MEAPKEAGIFERSNSRLVRGDEEGGLQEEEEAENPLMPLWMAIALYALMDAVQTRATTNVLPLQTYCNYGLCCYLR